MPTSAAVASLAALVGILGSFAALAQSSSIDWLDVSGETRIRYETLDGQFRANGTGGDQLLALRTLVKVTADGSVFDLVTEIHDARTYLDDDGTPLSTSFVNGADFLEAYLGFGDPKRSYLRAGRFTLDIASRRFAERNDFRNTINAYTGAHWIYNAKSGARLDAFLTAPVRKLPRDRDELDSNHWELDREDRSVKFWGIHYQHPNLVADVQADMFVYGLTESDEARPTPDRKVYAPGFRFIKQRAVGHLDFEVEAAYRWGSRLASTDRGSAKLDVRAFMLHAELGYTFDNAWQTRWSVEYDIASGDDDPNDSTYGRYERFFGTRRGDLGNTSIHGPLTRSNVAVAGIRFMFKRGRFDGRAIYQHASLHAAEDAFIVARVQDPTGRSGDFIGHTFDFRVRYWLVPEKLRLEVGGSALWFGEFVKDVPAGPAGSRTTFAYSQLTLTF